MRRRPCGGRRVLAVAAARAGVVETVWLSVTGVSDGTDYLLLPSGSLSGSGVLGPNKRAEQSAVLVVRDLGAIRTKRQKEQLDDCRFLGESDQFFSRFSESTST